MPNFPTNSSLQSGLGAHFALLTDLTRRSCDTMRKLSELHLQFAQQLMQDAADSSRNMLNCTDAFALAALAAQAAGPAAQHLHHYQHQLLTLMSGMQHDIGRSAQALVPEAAAMADHAARAASAFSLAGDGARYTPRHP